MAGLLDSVYRPPRQQQFVTTQPAPGPGWMSPGAFGGGMGGGGSPGGGGSAGAPSDASAMALQQYGPNGLLAQQMYQAMMQSGPYALMDPANASKWFTPETIGGLAPKYQDAYAAQTKKGKK